MSSLKLKTSYLSIVSLLLILPALTLSCSEEKTEKEVSMNGKNCRYTYTPESTELKWTAFKFTEKVGVGGTFDRYSVKNVNTASSVREAVNGLHFEIETDSVNSKNPERDARIQNFFFHKMTEPGKIMGSIDLDPLEEGKTGGTGTMQISLNGIQRNVPMNYKIMKDSEVEIWGNIDVNQWNAQDGLHALNEECKDLHTGKDGVSKLWSEVEFRAYTHLNVDCPTN